MDILKILSRGTKRTGNPTPTAKPVTKPANPQLYHDETRGLKRKRPEGDAELETPANDDDDEVDFFAPKKDNAKAADISKAPKAAKETPNAAKLLDEDEARQILRSHRLKFTLLSNPDDRKAKVKKSKKKQPVVQKKTKDGKEPLYPQPLSSFAQLRSTYSISTRLEENLAKQGYRIPTEVQLGSLPLLLHPEIALTSTPDATLSADSRNDVNFLAVAPTGSGKTLAFLIPTINGIMRRRAEGESSDSHGLEGIVIAPTRELAHQIVNEGRKLAQGTGIKIVGMKKGMRVATESQDQEDEVPSESDDEENAEDSGEDEDEADEESSANAPVTKADVLVTTPLLLLNLLTRGKRVPRTLPSVRYLVLDEADVLLDPLFREQTVGIWSACTHESLRVTCWSATMGSSVEETIQERLDAQQGPPAPLIRLVVGLKDTAVPSINHRLVYTATEQGKLFALRQLLHPNSSVKSETMPEMQLPFLVFTQTIERATALHSELKYDIPIEAGGSSRIAALHSSMSDSARSQIISRFRAGEIWVLITTDLLMRGIDFRGVNGVINYDVPTSAAAYVHRVGRTGRAGQQGGVAVTFYTTDDVKYLKSIANVISLSEKQAGKEEGVPKWLLDALPKVRKDDKQKLKERGVESRRGNKTKITSKSAWERRKEHNRRSAIEGSKKRKTEGAQGKTQNGDEWGGLDD